MSVRSLSLFALLLASLGSTAHAIVLPAAEGFNTGDAAWRGNTTATSLNWLSSGGIGDTGYVSTNLAITTTQPVLFRGEGALDSSNDLFVGDWLTAGALKVKAFVRHDAPVAMTFLVRVAPSMNTPGIQVTTPAPIQPGSWTPVEFDLHYSNPLLSVGAAPPLEPKYITTMGAVTNLQFALLRPSGYVDATAYKFDLDSVLVVPEPASMLTAALSALGCLFGLRVRRRSA